MIVDELPRTAVGKLDRKALPTPEFTGTGVEFRAPGTSLERRIADAFIDVLGVERVGVDDNFFELGGNSLIATRVVSRLNSALNIDVGVRVLFEAPTTAQLAERLSSAVTAVGTVPLTPMERNGSVPLSLAQKRMWFLNQFDTRSAAYNIPLAVRLTGDLDVTAMQQAIADVVERHETLRTVFPAVGGDPIQQVLTVDEAVPPVREMTLGEDELAERMQRLATTGFDVSVDLPLRVALFRLDTAEPVHILFVVVHHICADGSSMAPLARDVMTAYLARTAGTEPTWAPLEVQYADFTLWQHRVLGSEDDPESVISRQLHYWSEQLAGLDDVIALPADHPRPVQTDLPR